MKYRMKLSRKMIQWNTRRVSSRTLTLVFVREMHSLMIFFISYPSWINNRVLFYVNASAKTHPMLLTKIHKYFIIIWIESELSAAFHRSALSSANNNNRWARENHCESIPRKRELLRKFNATQRPNVLENFGISILNRSRNFLNSFLIVINADAITRRKPIRAIYPRSHAVVSPALCAVIGAVTREASLGGGGKGEWGDVWS